MGEHKNISKIKYNWKLRQCTNENNIILSSAGGVNGKSKLFFVVQTKCRWIYLFYIAWIFSPTSSVFPRYIYSLIGFPSFIIC